MHPRRVHPAPYEHMGIFVAPRLPFKRTPAALANWLRFLRGIFGVRSLDRALQALQMHAKL
jgi:hypothetical protein